jgi:ferric enterobactin receptor
MFKKLDPSITCFRRFLLIFLHLFLLTRAGIAQSREFSFNQPGSACYFSYICFAPDSNYNSINRPFIFILGKENQTVQQMFDEDTLRNSRQFHNYQFVYFPNRGQDAQDKLNCTESLVRIMTHGFQYGRVNLFFQVNDKTISPSDIADNGIKTVFKSIRLNYESADISQQNPLTDNILEEFKVTAVAQESVKKVKEDIGIYYVEDDKDKNEVEDTINNKSRKTYFGPPEVMNYALTGIIRDKYTGENLPFAGIYVKGTTIGVATNTDGYFTLLKVPTDTSTLIVQYLGYQKTEVFLTPQTAKKNFIIEIQPQSQTLHNVIVTAHKNDVSFVNKTETSIVKLSPKKLETLPSLGEKDIMRSFQLMPGVSASNESSSGLYVRGGTPDQNLVLYDGFTVYHVDHLYGFYSAFNSNALKDIQLYKGGFESKFGGRISSVTEITSKEGNQKNYNLGADLSLLCMNLFAEIPVGDKFSSFVAFRKSYKGALYDALFEKFNKKGSLATETVNQNPFGRYSQNQEVTSYFYDLNGKFTYHPGENDIISLSIFNGTDNLDNSSSSGIPSFGQFNSNFSMSSTDITKYGNIGSSLKWSRKWNSKLYGNTILSYSNYYSNRDRSQNRSLFNPNNESSTNQSGILEYNDLKDYSLKSDYQWDISNINQFQFGGFATYYDIKYTYAQSDTATILNRSGKALLSGIYLQDKLKFLKDKIQVLPGIRMSYFGMTNKLYFEPRVSLSYNITDKLIVKGAFGKYYQFANRVTREDILSGSTDFWILSDGNLIPMSASEHYIAGISYESKNYIFSAEGYYKNIQNLTEYSLRINVSPMGINYDENFFNGYGFSRGLEFLVQKNSGNLNGWICYTLGKAKNHFDVYSSGYYPANQDVTHEFKIVGLYKYKRWDFSANWIFATGRPYTSPSGAYSITLLDGSTQDYFTVTSKNSLRLPDYQRLDVSATYKILMGNKGDKRRREIGYVSFSLFNLYNRQNIWYKQYTIEEGKVIETNVTYFGIMPNLTISFKFR